MNTRCQCLCGDVDRILDARIRAATAQVAVHPHRDLGSIRNWIRLQQRNRSQRLARLTITTLHDVAAIPRVADGVDDRPGGALDGDHRFADGTLSREVMPDLLHLNEASYRTWAEAIEPKVKELMGEK